MHRLGRVSRAVRHDSCSTRALGTGATACESRFRPCGGPLGAWELRRPESAMAATQGSGGVALESPTSAATRPSRAECDGRGTERICTVAAIRVVRWSFAFLPCCAHLSRSPTRPAPAKVQLNRCWAIGTYCLAASCANSATAKCRAEMRSLVSCPQPHRRSVNGANQPLHGLPLTTTATWRSRTQSHRAVAKIRLLRGAACLSERGARHPLSSWGDCVECEPALLSAEVRLTFSAGFGNAAP